MTSAIELGATPLAVDRDGVPRLLGGSATQPAMPAVGATAAARMHVERLAPAWGVRSGGMPQLEALGEVRVAGGTIVRLRQVIDGIPVAHSAGGEVRLMIAKDNSLLAASGKLIASSTPRARAPQFADDDAGAVARAVTETYKFKFGPTFDRSTLSASSVARDGTRLFTGTTGAVHVSQARARKAWYPDGKQLTAAWVVEAYTSDSTSAGGEAYRTAIAADGRVLEHTNLTANEAYTYRVFADDTGELRPFDGPLADLTPHPTGTPNSVPFPAYVPSNLVTVDGLNHPAGQSEPDPWLTLGATETRGNNVDAYIDINAPNGFTNGDFRATVTTAPTMTTRGVFDRSYDPAAAALSSQAQQMAGITSLFYTINWLHDFWYDAGFTEAAGNAQEANFDRGGEDRDPLLAETQDNANGGSRNNANMATPSDGLNPRMQVFVWNNDKRSLEISGRKPATGTAVFGPRTFDLEGAVVLADDGVTLPAPGGRTTDACTALSAPATGKVVLVDRGSCSFKTKARNVQDGGGIAMILANTAAGAPGLGDDATITTEITIGVLSVSLADATTIKAELAAGEVTAKLNRVLGPELEGTLDATVVAHEFGHYVHHRLSVCNTDLCRAMSEGWADFIALMMVAREGDDLNKAYAMAAYSTQSFANDPLYFGIRRMPYSVSTAINALTFRDMGDDHVLPANPPIAPGGPNSEVHNAGEIWASMLWEGYVALQKAGTSFAEVRSNMSAYIVAGLLLAPPDATPTETRDAILAAVKAASPKDHDILAAAFARRGFGSCAISPPRDAVEGAVMGIVDSFEVKGQSIPGALRMKEMATCDHDEVLDAGETAQITVPIANPGPVDLTGVTVTVTSPDPSIRVVTPPIAVAKIAAYTKTSLVFYVGLESSVSTPTIVELNAQINSADGCGPVNVPLSVRVNTDDAADSSATDSFDATVSVWTPDGDEELWTHDRKSGTDIAWFGANSGGRSDTRLESPEITAGTDPVTVRFTHRYSFEEGFDGGVIEYTTDDGQSWKDVDDLADPGYSDTPLVPGSALAGRLTFTGDSAGYPDATAEVALDFGTQLAGKTFKLRFRIGTDGGVGAPGWEIDNVAFTGIVGTPFPTLVPNAKACVITGPDDEGDDDDDSGGCQAGGGLGAGNAGAALLILAVLLRRRRR